MKIQILTTLPDSWMATRPIRTYETRLISLGFRRYDVETKQVSWFLRNPDGTIDYDEAPLDDRVLSRAYATEQVRITVYSESPRVWVEETSPHERFVFVQQPMQVE